MTGPGHVATPKKILLATDLSCRSDRALDRAMHLSQEWNAQLLIVHVLPASHDILNPKEEMPDWFQDRDPLDIVRGQIRRDLAGNLDHVAIRVEEGVAADRILEIARQEKCDLIVTGIARNELLARILLGSTVRQLVNHSPVPVLVVKERAHEAYRKIAIATDFSQSSAHSAVTAAAFFPQANFTLLHCHDTPFAGLGAVPDAEDQLQQIRQTDGPEFLKSLAVDSALKSRIALHVEQGNPERCIWQYVRSQNIDLTVLGSHGRSAAFEILIGSTTRHLTETAGGDVLVVMDPRANR